MVCQLAQSDKFKVPAIIGMAAGIASLALSLMTFLSYGMGGFMFGAAGLVTSIIGLKSTTQKGKTKLGLIFSIIGLAVACLGFIISAVIVFLSNYEYY